MIGCQCFCLCLKMSTHTSPSYQASRRSIAYRSVFRGGVSIHNTDTQYRPVSSSCSEKGTIPQLQGQCMMETKKRKRLDVFQVGNFGRLKKHTPLLCSAPPLKFPSFWDRFLLASIGLRSGPVQAPAVECCCTLNIICGFHSPV